MAVLFFSSGMKSSEHQIRKVVESMGHEIEVFRSIHTFEERFTKPNMNIFLLILLIKDLYTLDKLLELNNSMYEMPIILVLYDSKDQTLRKAHKFFPRYITFIGSDYSNMAEPIKNIINIEKAVLNKSAQNVFVESEGKFGR